MRLVGPDEREPEGAVSLAVIVEDLTAVRGQVIELEAEAEKIPDGENIATQLRALRVMTEAVIGLAQAERANQPVGKGTWNPHTRSPSPTR